MKINIHHIVLLVFCLGSVQTSLAQQSTLIGHQDLIGYFNPALNSGSNGQISYLYRYQWEDIGPSSNTLFFRYPLKSNGKVYSPNAVGSIFQYEDFDLANRARLEFFLANTLFNSDELKVGFGLNAGLSYTGINTDDFNAEELIDPELSDVNQRLSLTNKIGFSIYHRLLDVGIAARFVSARKVSDYHSSFAFKIPIHNPKIKLNPIAVMRVSESLDYQLEVQVNTTYDEKISLTVGYRQNFGAIFQLGIQINKSAKASYGIETPNSNASAFGLTHELLGSYFFESPAIVQHRKDSVIKVKRDSLNRVRIERYRKQKEEEIIKQDSLAKAKKLEDEFKEQQKLEELPENTPNPVLEQNEEGIYSSLDELTGNASDNTHVILDHIGFEPGLYLLTPDSYAELDKLYNYIRHHKSLHIEIQGHTDNSGSPETNLSLSKYRAMAVFNYLISRGIDSAKMNVVGYGENQPLYPNDTKENRELNRRIEIVFINR